MIARESELRALVVAPTGRDGELICNLLEAKSVACQLFPTAEGARIEAAAGAGTVIMAEEALLLPDIDSWAAQMGEQPSWSELFFILLTVPGERSRRKMLAQQPLGNMVLLERPVRPETLISTVRAALRSRRRQYEMRDHMAAVRLAEIALRKSEKLVVAGRLALSISHEINNPLAAVTNLLYLIGQSPSLNEAKGMAETASQELARVAEIVAQTLRFYRDPGKPSVVHVGEIVDSALTLYRARLASAEIEIERDFRDCAPIVALPGEVRQVILNLIGNAIDAIGRGGRLKIRAANSRQYSNGSLRGIRLSVADTGSGIHPEVRHSLFEPFISTKGDTGTGLGLWLSSQIIHKHGGTIQVKSRARAPSTGTVFSVFLPLEPHFEAHAAAHNGSIVAAQTSSTWLNARSYNA
ncbi:MAG TPA: ATP-binding protein [Terracidiphilus sp.]|jgi:signal transduction histidine kinase|nr:ATP-binding protein [Terracidiphilus sp.]